GSTTSAPVGSRRSRGPTPGGKFWPTMPTVDFDPRAIQEARAARLWYARRSPAVAARFVAAFDAAVAQVETAPKTGSPHAHGTRVRALRRFPYSLVYVEQPNSVLVVAVAH